MNSLLRSGMTSRLGYAKPPSRIIVAAWRATVQGSPQPARWRFASNNAKASQVDAKPPPRQFLYPERLCVFHAGTGRITFLACLKLTTLFVFVFFGFLVTPKYYEKEGGWTPTTTRTLLSGIIPLVFVAYTTSPFVTFVHLRLPPYARQSEELLRAFLRKLPATTELEVSSMNVIAKPRASRVKLSDLRPTNERFGIVNFARDTSVIDATRRWYHFPANSRFSIQGNTVPRASWAWDELAAMISRQKP